MHKIFAKTLFLGKHVVYLPECHSTNTVASEMATQTSLSEGTVVITDRQIKGRGQRGNSWVAQPGKNLTFTLVLKPGFLKITDQFSISMVISLALQQAIAELTRDQHVSIKWPNDIYIEDRKCAGILVENSLKGQKLEYSFVGIGLNVNQQTFSIAGPGSLMGVTGAEYELNEVLERILLAVERYYLMLRNKGSYALRPLYLQHLRWINEWRTYASEGKLFNGKILGVDPHGRLVVQTDTDQRSFDIKEISFIK